MLRRISALVLSALLMAAFYVFAVMQENEETKRSDAFVVQKPELPVARIVPFQSRDGRALAQAFGAAFPLPEGPFTGEVASSGHHGYGVMRLSVQGQISRVEGVRPLSAASSILPGGLRFAASEHALFGYAIMSASDGQTLYYALQTDEAAFVISLPENAAGAPGSGFALQEP